MLMSEVEDEMWNDRLIYKITKPSGQNRQKKNHVVKNTLLQTVFSAIFPAGNTILNAWGRLSELASTQKVEHEQQKNKAIVTSHNDDVTFQNMAY